MQKLPIFDQKKTPSCTAHAVVSAMQTVLYNSTGQIINLSPRFLDILSGTEADIYEGRNMKTVMELSCKIGCCTENLLPNDTGLPIEEYRNSKLITKEMMVEAAKYRMAGFKSIF